MMTATIISHEEPLQYFYNNQPNRKLLSRSWLSQCFSTGETIPDIMLVWALESRRAIKTSHMIKKSVCNLNKTNLFSDPLYSIFA